MKSAGELIQINLKRLRAERGWTQEKLADKAGISLNSVQRIEARIRFPREDNITALAGAFVVPEAELFREPPATSQLQEKGPQLVESRLVLIGSITAGLTALEQDELGRIRDAISLVLIARGLALADLEKVRSDNK